MLSGLSDLPSKIRWLVGPTSNAEEGPAARRLISRNTSVSKLRSSAASAALRLAFRKLLSSPGMCAPVCLASWKFCTNRVRQHGVRAIVDSERVTAVQSFLGSPMRPSAVSQESAFACQALPFYLSPHPGSSYAGPSQPWQYSTTSSAAMR